MRRAAIVWSALVASLIAAQALAQAVRKPARPVEPIAALVDAFRTHDVVAIAPHGNNQVQALLLALIRNPRFPTVANDIVVEAASARYQDVLDRFVRGDDVPDSALRHAWEEHTVPNNLGVHVAELIRAVRAVNAGLPGERRIRVIAGDPPIDWDHVTTRADHWRWIELRDSYPADLIRRQVLDRGRRALVVYGEGHLQRAHIAANYDLSVWQAQTVVSLLAQDPRARVFTVFLLESGPAMPEAVASWPVPSLAIVEGTDLGGRDFAEYARDSIGAAMRVSVRDGQLTPIARDEWKVVPLERQFDALLYLGAPSSFTHTFVTPALCEDSDFMVRRLQRMAEFGPPVEVQNLKKACGLQ